jgi:exosortase/archaeosortase family protein
MNFFKTITPLTWRVVVFVCLFIVVSGLIGPRIISGGILFRDGFAAYGGIGKALLFSLIAFALLARHNKASITLRSWRPALLGWIAAAIIAFVVAWMAISNLLAGTRELSQLVLAHGGLIGGLLLAGIGCVGPKNIQLIWDRYKREIVSSIALGVAFYLFLQVVYMLWQPLAFIVLVSVNFMLGLSGLEAIILPPHTLIFDKFGITVAEFCSGVESIALFTGLYAVVGLLDWGRLNRRRYFIIFPIALAVLFLFNIVRVYGLIMAGYYINAEIAFSLFHTYAGMVFFILYSAIFWSICYKYMIKKQDIVNGKHS